jgi:hypothetical protein
LISIVAVGLSSCSIGRVYRGSPIQGDPDVDLTPGVTDRAEVLRTFGAPDRIYGRRAGDVFIYRFVRENSRSFTLEEPVITNFELFSYSVVEEREDRLVILFDPDGRVESYGYLRGTEDLDR